ncbi:MAG: hypothetical protein R6V04_04060 [bacterium]
MKISKRTKFLAIFIFGWNIGIFIASSISHRDLHFPLSMMIGGTIGAVIMYILGVDKMIKKHKND